MKHRIHNWLVSNEENNNRVQTIFVAIIILALIIRVLYVLFVAPNLDPIIRRNPLHGDASGYHVLALNLQQGLGLTWDGETPTSYRMPGYVAFVAFMYTVFGPYLTPIRLVQALLGAFTCVPVFAIAQRLYTKKFALLASLGVALHPLLIYMTAWVYSETLFLLLLWTSLWLLMLTFESAKPWRVIFVGMILGLSTLVRPEIFLFTFLVLAASWLLRWQPQVIRALGAVAVVLILVVLPWTIRNIQIHHKFVLLTTSAGSNLYAGNNPQANGGSAWTYPIEGLSEVDSDLELRKQAGQWIINHPLEFLDLLPKKLFKLFSSTSLETGGNPLGRYALPIDIIYGLFLLIAALGMLSNWRTKVGIMLLVLIAWAVLIALVFYGGTRVALPLAPALVIFAVAGVIHLWERKFFTAKIYPQKIELK